MSFRGGVTRHSTRSSKLKVSKLGVMLVFAVLALLAGCGESASVAEDASVAAYVAAPLCAEAEKEAASVGGRAGELRVRVVCLPAVESDGRVDLAQIGANARRATQDSSAVGYIGETTPAATRFSAPILEAAELAQLPGPNGATSMNKLLKAIAAAPDGTNPRQPIYNELK